MACRACSSSVGSLGSTATIFSYISCVCVCVGGENQSQNSQWNWTHPPTSQTSNPPHPQVRKLRGWLKMDTQSMLLFGLTLPVMMVPLVNRVWSVIIYTEWQEFHSVCQHPMNIGFLLSYNSNFDPHKPHNNMAWVGWAMVNKVSSWKMKVGVNHGRTQLVWQTGTNH